MAKNVELSREMSLKQFDNGYWYATEIRSFAKDLGIVAVHGLRKDELETLIRRFLKTGLISRAESSPPRLDGPKDSDVGLTLDLPVRRFTNNRETKEFIVESARKMDKNFKEKSGARYRLNRWREGQVAKGRNITYGDLVQEFVSLCKTEGPFPQAPSGRYINFLSDYFAAEEEPSREEALAAWKKLKKLGIPKNYSAWKKHMLSET